GVAPRRDADDFTVAIDDGTAGVAAVDRDIRLQNRNVRDVALDGGDVARAQRRLEIAVAREPAADHVIGAARDGRVADGPDGIGDAHRIRITDANRGKVLPRNLHERQIRASLVQRRREIADPEGELLSVGELDFVDHANRLELPAGHHALDVAIEAVAAMNGAERFDGKVAQQRGDRAVAEQLVAQRR